MTPAELKRQLKRRFPYSPPPNKEVTSHALVVAALSTINRGGDVHRPLLERLVDAGEEDFDAVILSSSDAALLSWVDEAFRLLFKQHSLDSALATPLQDLLPVAAALAVSENAFLDIGEHPLQKLVDTIYRDAIGWHRGLGRAGEALLTEISEYTREAQNYFEYQERSFEEMCATLQAFLAAEAEPFERMQARVIESELGRLKAASARITAGQALNDLMQGKEFPALILDFLQGAWFDSLQLILILHGQHSDQWARAMMVTDTLVWTVQPFDSKNDEHRQRLYKIIPKVPKELRQLLLSLENDPDAAEQAMTLVEEMHFRLLRNAPPPFKRFEPLDLGAAANRGRVSKQMLLQLAAFEPGQWFLIQQENGQSLRVRLALKLDDFEQLLFVSRSGAKACIRTSVNSPICSVSGSPCR